MKEKTEMSRIQCPKCENHAEEIIHAQEKKACGVVVPGLRPF